MALSINKGRNQLHLRNEIFAAREDVGKAIDRTLQHIDTSSEAIKVTFTTSSADAEANIQASLKTLQGEVTASASEIRSAIQVEGAAIRHDLYGVATAVENSVTLASADIEKTKNLIADRSQSLTLKLDANHASMHKQVATSISQQHNGFVAIQKSLGRNHAKQVTAMDRQLRETNRNGRQLRKIHETIMHIASITIAESADKGFELSGVNHEELLLPLTPIKSQLTKLAPIMVNNKSVGLSPAEFEWVQQEFHALLAQASLSQYHSAQKASRSSLQDPGSHRQSHRLFSSSINGTYVDHSSQWKNSLSIPKLNSSHSLDTPMGTLCLIIYRSNGAANREATESVTTIRFAFFPRLELCTTGFDTLFTRQQSAPLFRQIRVYNLLHGSVNEQVRDMIMDGNILGLQDLLGRHKISRSDCVSSSYVWSEHPLSKNT